jgi:hypothetical protein
MSRGLIKKKNVGYKINNLGNRIGIGTKKKRNE